MNSTDLESNINGWKLENAAITGKKINIQYRKTCDIDIVHKIDIENIGDSDDEFKAELKSLYTIEEKINTINSSYDSLSSIIEECRDWMENDEKYVSHQKENAMTV